VKAGYKLFDLTMRQGESLMEGHEYSSGLIRVWKTQENPPNSQNATITASVGRQ
jgi:hypothetical protein